MKVRPTGLDRPLWRLKENTFLCLSCTYSTFLPDLGLSQSLELIQQQLDQFFTLKLALHVHHLITLYLIKYQMGLCESHFLSSTSLIKTKKAFAHCLNSKHYSTHQKSAPNGPYLLLSHTAEFNVNPAIAYLHNIITNQCILF